MPFNFHRTINMNELHEQIEALLRSEPNRKTVLEQILHVVLQNFHSETGTIDRSDSENHLLYLAAQVGLRPQMLEVVNTIPVGKGIAGQVIASGKPVTLCNLQTNTGGVARPGARQSGVGGALCVPLRDGYKMAGTLGIGTHREHEYTPEETRELEEVARLIGRFLKL